MVLAPAARAATLAKLTAAFTRSRADRMREPQLEELRSTIPAARSLPLLGALARRAAARVVVDYLPHLRLALEVQPCN